MDLKILSFLHTFISLLSVSQTVSSEVKPVCGADRKKWQPGDVPLAVAYQTLEDTSITTAGEFLPVHALNCTQGVLLYRSVLYFELFSVNPKSNGSYLLIGWYFNPKGPSLL